MKVTLGDRAVQGSSSQKENNAADEQLHEENTYTNHQVSSSHKQMTPNAQLNEEQNGSPLTNSPFRDEECAIENLGPEVSPAEALLKSSISNARPQALRSKSFVSFDLRLLNDTVGKWKKQLSTKLPNWYVRSKHVEGAPNEIQYSVFRPSTQFPPLRQIPPEGFVNSGPMNKETFDVIVENTIEAMEHLGAQPRRIAAGSSGSYFVYNTSNEIVAVFKPKDEEPYGPLSPKWTKWVHRNLFPFFFGRSCLIPNLGYICEAAASLLDRQLQTFIVPYTETVSLSSPSFYYPFIIKKKHKNGVLPKKVGSYQLFLEGYMEADQFLKKYPFPGSSWIKTTKFPVGYSDALNKQLYFEWTPEVIQQFRDELEKLVILDYIMRNTDRGLDNWMIKIEWEVIECESLGTSSLPVQKVFKKVPRLKIGAIDSGLSWPWKHPDEWRSFPFGWLFLPLSIIGHPFSEKTKAHFLPLLTSVSWWEESKVLFRQLFARDLDFKERMWKKQWAVMKGQAFNVVEALKTPGQGPLDLARRTRMLVWDDEIDIPVQLLLPPSIAIDPSMWRKFSEGSKLASDASPLSSSQNTPAKALQHSLNVGDSPVRKALLQKSLNPHIETIVENESSSLPSLNESLDVEAYLPNFSVDLNTKQIPATAKKGKEEILPISAFDDPFSDSYEVTPRELENLQSSWTDLLKGNITEEKFDQAKSTLIINSSRSRYINSSGISTPEHQVVQSSDVEASKNPQSDRNDDKKNEDKTSVKKNAATKRVIVERLETVTSKPPVFTWC